MSKSYNLKNIRTLLTEGFSPDELRYFSHDTPNFKAVYNELAQTTGKAEIAHRLLEYANQQGRIDELLAWAKEQNSLGYEKYGPYYQSVGGDRIDEETVKALLEQAEAYCTAGKWKEAVQEATAALKLDHCSSCALTIRAEAYAGLDRWDDTMRDATEALGIDPRNVRAWCVRARTYMNLGCKWDEVIYDTTEAIGIEPGNTYALIMRAWAYFWRGRLDDAIRDTTEVMNIESQDNHSLNFLAFAVGLRAILFMTVEKEDEEISNAKEFLKIPTKQDFNFKLCSPFPDHFPDLTLEFMRELLIDRLKISK